MASVINRINEFGKSDVPDLLRKYVLGADEDGRDLYEILDYDWDIDGAFYVDEDSITDAHDTVIYLNEIWSDNTQYIYIKYENVGYKIVVNYDYDEETGEETFTTTDVVKVYEPTGDEGEKVPYSVDGTSPTKDWLVLYDNGDTVDMTPVELELNNSWSYTLGYQDPAAIEALPSGPSGNDLDRAIWSYNHAVDTLNEKCGEIVTNISSEDGEMVRSIGTSFGIATDEEKLENASNLYSSTFLASNPEGREDEGYYDGKGLKGDMDAEQDVVRMSYFSPGNSYETYGYASTGFNAYWLASRGYGWDSSGFRCGMHFVFGGSAYNPNILWEVNRSGASPNFEVNETTCLVRPVVRVRKSVVGLAE